MCRFCKRHFSSISCLKVHLRLHLGLCKVIDFTVSLSLLQLGFFVVLGLKPFHCPYCTMKFSQRGNMESHLYRYHKGEIYLKSMDLQLLDKLYKMPLKLVGHSLLPWKLTALFCCWVYDQS
jgi:uncharacterized Zn-finger protein